MGGHGSEAWIRGLLNNPGDEKYFGHTKLDGMKKWRKGIEKARRKNTEKERAEEDMTFDKIAKWLADQGHPKEKRDPSLEKESRSLFEDNCASCHSIGDVNKGSNTAPDFTDYGSQDWLRLTIMNPGHKLRFGAKNQMPYFRNLDGPGAEVYNQEFQDTLPDKDAKPNVMPLSDIDRELIIRWMTRDDRVVFGGRPVAGPPKRDKAE